MRTRISARLGREDGWTIVVAIVVMGLMLSLGLAAFAYVDQQARTSADERVRESSFNLTEGALSSQIFTLSQIWPGETGTPYPDVCDQTTLTTVRRCPNKDDIAGSFTSVDFRNTTTWTTRVRDNVGPNTDFYRDSLAFAGSSTVPRQDANGDGKVWVRAQGVVGGRKRTLIALVQIEEIAENFPRSVLTAGHFEVAQSGNQLYISTGDSNVQVRCSAFGPNCAEYDPSKNQIAPGGVDYNYAGGNALSADAQARFKRTAIDNGTYCGPDGSSPGFCDASNCAKPAQLNKPGQVVYLAPGGSTRCDYGNNVKPCCGVDPTGPEFLILENGKLRINTTLTFYGIIYHMNKQNSCDEDLVELKGGLTVKGAVAVDGCGGVSAGSTDINLLYDPSVFNAVKSFGNAGIIRNTFREITGTEAG